MSGQLFDKRHVKHLVVAIHGIRTAADWKENVRKAIENDPITGERDETIKFELIGYGYFDLLRFLLPFLFARSRIHEIYAKINGYQQEYPRLAETSVIAHSLGTYLLARLLMLYPLRLHRIVLCASIVPPQTAYWNAIRKSVERDGAEYNVRNDCSPKDIWPALAYATWWYGNTGNLGAQFPGVVDIFHSFRGHSEFLTNAFARTYWRPFLVEGRVQRPEVEVINPDRLERDLAAATPWYTSQLPVVLRLGQLACLAVVMVLAGARATRRELVAIPAGTIGVMDSWGYSLDEDAAVLAVKGSKVPGVAGRKFVFIVAKNPGGRPNVLDIKETVVSPIQDFENEDGHNTPLHLPCQRIGIESKISYGDNVMFYAYVVDSAKCDQLVREIADQDNHPLTVRRIQDEFGGIKVGGGSDGATFDETNEHIKKALEELETRRRAIASAAR
jgi:pimeloyl-ACP methyl ester carboxylesterase